MSSCIIVDTNTKSAEIEHECEFNFKSSGNLMQSNKHDISSPLRLQAAEVFGVLLSGLNDVIMHAAFT